MRFQHSRYTGTGINHDDDHFTGHVAVQRLGQTDAYRLRYQAFRTENQKPVHEEWALLAPDETGTLCFDVQMDELPCLTRHRLRHQSDTTWVFAYSGTDQLAGFNSEVEFAFDGDVFTYRHRWAMNGPATDKSWCTLEPVT